MKTLKIKLEIETEVPEGEYCEHKGGMPCDNWRFGCSLFPKEELDIIKGMTFKYLKCPQCLEACKKGVE